VDRPRLNVGDLPVGKRGGFWELHVSAFWRRHVCLDIKCHHCILNRTSSIELLMLDIDRGVGVNSHNLTCAIIPSFIPLLNSASLASFIYAQIVSV